MRDNLKNDDHFLSELLYQAIDGVFTGRDKDILLRRVGFFEGGCQTLSRIGKVHGISRERVRQLEIQILKKFRAAWKANIKLPSHNLAAVKFKETLDSVLLVEKDNIEDRIANLLEYEFSDLNADILLILIDVAYNLKLRSLVKKGLRQKRGEKRAQHLFGEFQKFFVWSEKTNFDCQKMVEQYSNRVREIDPGGWGNSGSYFSNKLGVDVYYESELEHQILLFLEEYDEVIYYKEQPLALNYDYFGRKRTYFPDILIVFKDGRAALIEIKPRLTMALYENWCKYEALKKYCEENGLGYCMTDGRNSFEYYRAAQFDIPANMESALMSELESGIIDWNGFKRIRAKAFISAKYFRALIFKHSLIWELSPFRLSKGQDVVNVDKPLSKAPEILSIPMIRLKYKKIGKKFSTERVRRKYPKAYMPWTDKEDDELRQQFLKGLKSIKLAKLFQRQHAAIVARLKKLNLM